MRILKRVRSSLLPLPYPFVVPGGRFGEMYYWDSYFTMLGLVQSGRSDLAAGKKNKQRRLPGAESHN